LYPGRGGAVVDLEEPVVKEQGDHLIEASGSGVCA
jgi:hypothetical protein